MDKQTELVFKSKDQIETLVLRLYSELQELINLQELPCVGSIFKIKDDEHILVGYVWNLSPDDYLKFVLNHLSFSSDIVNSFPESKPIIYLKAVFYNDTWCSEDYETCLKNKTGITYPWDKVKHYLVQ